MAKYDIIQKIGLASMLGLAGSSYGCATTEAAVRYSLSQRGLQQQSLTEKLQQEYQCIGTADIPSNIRNPVLARNTAGNRARADYIERCMGQTTAITGAAAKKTINVEYDPAQNIAIAYKR